MSKRRRGEISITYMSGPYDGKTIVFEQPASGKQRIISIGRRDGCDIHMSFDNQVSRLHARLTCSALIPGTHSDETSAGTLLAFYLEDAGSRNGTFVEKNEEPITRRVNLQPGTLFRIGRTWLRLDIPLSFDD